MPISAKSIAGWAGKTLSELDRYAYCGHSVIMEKRKHKWRDRNVPEIPYQ